MSDLTIPASVLATCAECGLPVVFIGHHGDIATHAAPDLDPDRTVEAVAANRTHDPQPIWRRPVDNATP